MIAEGVLDCRKQHGEGGIGKPANLPVWWTARVNQTSWTSCAVTGEDASSQMQICPSCDAPHGPIGRVLGTERCAPTRCAFGGSDHDTPFITRMRQLSSGEGVEQEPGSSGFFAAIAGANSVNDAPIN